MDTPVGALRAAAAAATSPPRCHSHLLRHQIIALIAAICRLHRHPCRQLPPPAEPPLFSTSRMSEISIQMMRKFSRISAFSSCLQSNHLSWSAFAVIVSSQSTSGCRHCITHKARNTNGASSNHGVASPDRILVPGYLTSEQRLPQHKRSSQRKARGKKVATDRGSAAVANINMCRRRAFRRNVCGTGSGACSWRGPVRLSGREARGRSGAGTTCVRTVIRHRCLPPALTTSPPHWSAIAAAPSPPSTPSWHPPSLWRRRAATAFAAVLPPAPPSLSPRHAAVSGTGLGSARLH